MEEYPNRIDFANFEELENIIKSKKFKSNKYEINKWINKFAGPLPPSDFSKRVLKVVKQVLNSKR